MRYHLRHGTEDHIGHPLGCVAAACTGGRLGAAQDTSWPGLDFDGPIVSSVGGKRGVNDAPHAVINGGAEGGQREIDGTLHLIGIVCKVQGDILIFDLYSDRQLDGTTAHAVGIKVVGERVRSIGNLGQGHADLALGIVQ